MNLDTITTAVAGLHEHAWKNFGMLVLDARRDQLLPLVARLKEQFGFDLLLDITAIDYPERDPRFDLVYHMYSSHLNQRLRIKVRTDADPGAPTLTHRYGSAHYQEREVHEMYGIGFDGNSDLRPILLYEGFEGHPLRKDYPIDLEQPIVDYRR